MNRRIRKQVWTCTDPNSQPVTWTLAEDRRFVWGGENAGGWLMLAEMRCTDPNDPCNCGTGFQPVRTQTWGLDLAGMSGDAAHGGAALQGAGGISGLLAVHDANDPADPNDAYGDYVYTYDANGNVGQVVNWSRDPNDPNGAIVAKYQYDPYGNPLHSVTDVNASGPYAAANPYRFSTKPFDDEIGWGYWGERYYDPKQGRWTNHDPIGELGGMSLYAYVRQNPVSGSDALGQCILGTGMPGCGWELPWGPTPYPEPDGLGMPGGAPAAPVTDACPRAGAPSGTEQEPCGDPEGMAVITDDTGARDEGGWKQAGWGNCGSSNLKGTLHIGVRSNDELIDLVCANAKRSKSKCVSQLNVSGHGRDGGVAYGTDRASFSNRYLTTEQLYRLRSCLCGGARITLNSCNSGLYPDDLQELANKLGVTVCGCAGDCWAGPCDRLRTECRYPR